MYNIRIVPPFLLRFEMVRTNQHLFVRVNCVIWRRSELYGCDSPPLFSPPNPPLASLSPRSFTVNSHFRVIYFSHLNNYYIFFNFRILQHKLILQWQTAIRLLDCCISTMSNICMHPIRNYMTNILHLPCIFFFFLRQRNKRSVCSAHAVWCFSNR